MEILDHRAGAVVSLIPIATRPSEWPCPGTEHFCFPSLLRKRACTHKGDPGQGFLSEDCL